jgi:DNA-directed RNA polymerase specialized sigma24 family protein
MNDETLKTNEDKKDNNDVHDAYNEEELNRLFEMYLPNLVRMADKQIASQLKKIFDADDVVLSVFGTIVRRMKERTFTFEDDAEFWRLLVTIAKRKISNKVRDASTQSRSYKKEVADVAQEIVASPEPGPDEAGGIRRASSNASRGS